MDENNPKRMGGEPTANENEMQFDNLHTLENFLDIYDNPAEMVLTEALANSIDVNSTEVKITIGELRNSPGKYLIRFEDNGPGMDASQFDNYHVGSRSSKSKGNGIGFAGIGAKVYLAAYSDTEIITETCCGSDSLASKMYLKDRKIMWKLLKSQRKTVGTSYSVILREEDYNYLKKNLEELIIESFNNAILGGLKITINGESVKPWLPKAVKTKQGVLKVGEKKLPFTFLLCEDEIPPHKRNMELHVSGKKITVRKPSYILDLKADYQYKIYIVVDAMDISDYLKTDKVSFKPGFVNFHVIRGLDKETLKIAKEFGLMAESKPSTFESNQLTKALEDILKDPEFAWLNPLAQKIISCGPTGPGTGSSGTSCGGTRSSTSKSTGAKRLGTGLSIMYVFEKDNPKDGWLDLATNRPVVNLEQPLYLKVEHNVSARNYHVAKVVISSLVRHAAVKKGLSAEEALDLQTELLTKVRDAIWC